MKSSSVNRNANMSAVGYDNHIPSICQNLGSINISGRKNNICRDIAVRKAGTALPIDWNSTEPTTWKPIKNMQRDINLAALVDCMMREASLVKMRMIGSALITSGRLLNVCGEIGTSVMASNVACNIGPPADRA